MSDGHQLSSSEERLLACLVFGALPAAGVIDCVAGGEVWKVMAMTCAVLVAVGLIWRAWDKLASSPFMH